MILYCIVACLIVFCPSTLASTCHVVKTVRNSPNSVLAQGPFWDKKSNSVYYVDIERPSVLRYDYYTKRTYEAKIENEEIIGFMVAVADNDREFIVGLGNKAVVIEWDGKTPYVKRKRTLFEVATGTEQVLNDGEVDKFGRLYTGTLRDLTCDHQPDVANASFYRFTKSEGVVTLFSNVYISNGIAFDDINNVLYYIGACQLNVKAFDYNPQNGEITNGRVAVDFRINGRYPGFIATGITIDRDGFLWVTAYGGYKIFKINPRTGKIVMKIAMPVRSVISCVFGGPNMDILYVTTGNNMTDIRYGNDVIGNNPYSILGGRLFEIHGLGSKGYYPNKVELR